MILAAGSRHKRFIVETVRKLKEDCYISTLRILETQKSDSFTYELRLSNAHGADSHAIHLVIRGKSLFSHYYLPRTFSSKQIMTIYTLNKKGPQTLAFKAFLS